MHKIALALTIVPVLVFFLGCNDLQRKDFTTHTYKVLKLAAIAYNQALGTASALYKDGLLTDEEAAAIEQGGWAFKKAYGQCVTALEAYETYRIAMLQYSTAAEDNSDAQARAIEVAIKANEAKAKVLACLDAFRAVEGDFKRITDKYKMPPADRNAKTEDTQEE